MNNTTERLRRALGKMLPSGIEFGCAKIPKKYPIFKYDLESELMEHASLARQAEFSSGRDCARVALDSCGARPGPILRDPRNLPIWPQGYIGSISHSREYCAALGCDHRLWYGVGLDLEMTNRLSEAAMTRVLRADEASFAAGCQKKASLIFSAKEAFYKLQFPEWGIDANFSDLAFAEPEFDSSEGVLKIAYLGECFPAGLSQLRASIQFRYEFIGDLVVTASWLARAKLVEQCS